MFDHLFATRSIGEHFGREFRSLNKFSVNYSQKAIENHYGEVPVVVHTNIKHLQQKKNIYK